MKFDGCFEKVLGLFQGIFREFFGVFSTTIYYNLRESSIAIFCHLETVHDLTMFQGNYWSIYNIKTTNKSTCLTPLNIFGVNNFCEKRYLIFGPSIALVLYYLTRKLSTPVKENIPRGLRNTSNGGSFELHIKNVGLNNRLKKGNEKAKDCKNVTNLDKGRPQKKKR